MFKRIVIGSLAVSSLLLGTNPALAYHSPLAIYHTFYYSDSSLQNRVGALTLRYCTYDPSSGNGATYRLMGSQSAYQVSGLAGYCDEGSFQPDDF